MKSDPELLLPNEDENEDMWVRVEKNQEGEGGDRGMNDEDAYDPDPSARLSAVLAQGTLDKDKADILSTWGTVRLDKEFSDALRNSVEAAEDIPTLIELLGKDKAVALLAELIEANEYEEPWVSQEILENETTAGIQKMMDTMRENTKRMAETFINRALRDVQEEKQATPKGLSGFEDTGLGHLPCNPFVSENLGAQMLGGKGWQNKQGGFELNAQGLANIYKNPSKGGSIHITLGGFDAAEQAASQIQSTILEQYGALSVDVTLTLLAILGDPRQVHYPLVETVYITTKTILKNKGFERYGKDARLIEQQIETVINALAKLRVYFRGVKIDGREAIEIPDGKLFDIERTFVEQKNIDGTWTRIETGWVMRLGMWVNLFLNPQNRLWLSDVSRDILELDHRDNRQAAQMAKFIWVRFLGCPAGRFHEDDPVRVRVAVLLEKIGFLPIETERGTNWYRRTRENVEKALGKLLRLGAVARWHYSDAPFDPTAPDIEDKAPGNAAKWLDAYLILVDPASLPEAERRRLLYSDADEADKARTRALRRANRIDDSRERRGKPQPQRERLTPVRRTPLVAAQDRLKTPETRAELKKKRLSLGLQQGELAKLLGISRQTYGNIERGEFAPGDKTGTAEKLLTWLDSPDPDPDPK